MEISKIITLEPASTEVVSLLDGNSSRIIGVSDKCDFPHDVKFKPKVVRSLIKINDEMSSLEIDRKVKNHLASKKPIYEIDWETINKLQPDLLVGQSICGVCAFPVNSLLSYQNISLTLVSINVFDYSPKNFQEIFQRINDLGKLIEREENAQKIYDDFEKAKKELRSLCKNLRVVLIEWLMPIYIAGLWTSHIFELSGAKTILASGEEGKMIDWSVIRKFNPDVIFISPCGFGIKRTLKEIDLIYSLPGFKETNAFRENNVFVVDSAYTSRPSPRVLDFVKEYIKIMTGSEPRKDVMVRLE